jgi:hypothetical protein
MGFLLFAGVAPAPTTYRLSAVAPLGLILLVWLIRGQSRLSRVLTVILWVVAACLAIAFPLRIQTQGMRSLDLPRGRMALDPMSYEMFLWVSQHTVPGEFFFTAAGTGILFPLALRNPAEVPYVKPNDYTRPEQVRNVVAALEGKRVRFVLWESGLDPESNYRSGDDHIGPLRGYLRSCYHVLKTALGGDYRPRDDHLEPLRNYLHSHYHVVKISSDSSEVWERNKTLVAPSE